jgi:hypothetical protein
MGLLRFYSKTVAWSGRASDHPINEFVPKEGPNGGRVICDKMHVYAACVVSNTGATNEAEDVHRILKNLVITTAQGVQRWNLNGDASRVALYQYEGPDAFPEVADISSSASGLALLVHQAIPFTKRYIHTPDDFALPADEFGEVIITGPSATELDIGSADATLTSISFYCVAECHEDLDLQFYCTDVVKQDTFQTLTEATAKLGGKLHDLSFHAVGASGGASLANLTSVRIDQPMGLMVISTTAELLKEYRVKRKVANNLNSTAGGELRMDPFAVGAAIPVFVADDRTSCWEGPYIDELKVNMVNSVASVRMISRTAKPRDMGAALRVAAAYGLKGDNALVVKTKSKTKRSLSAWPEHLRNYLRLKANLQRRAA